MVHPGSWWGLPDLGITEKLSNVLGQPRTAQGGSNLSGTVDYTAQRIAGVSPNPQASSGSVLGASTTQNYSPMNYSPNVGSNTSTTNIPSAPSGPDLSNPVKQDEWARANGFDGWNAYQDLLNSSQSQSAAELASLNTEYDRNAELARNQLSALENQRTNSLANLDNQRNYLLSQVGDQKTQAYSDRDKNINTAAQAARNTQAKSRNMLRALGILNSSAAGDILSRPLNEFDQTKAEYTQMAQQRVGELDNFLNAKTSELAIAVKELEDNYANLASQIQTDLRFSDRERADAIRQANAALSQRMAEIKMAQQEYVQQVEAQKANIALSLAQAGQYSMPGYDVNQMLSTMFNPQTQTYTGGQASIFGDDKKRLSGLYS